MEGTFPERKALIRNFVQGIEIVEDEAVLTYTIPMLQDGVTSDSDSVLDFVQSGPPWWIRTRQYLPNAEPNWRLSCSWYSVETAAILENKNGN